MADLRALSEEAAEALLIQIRDIAPNHAGQAMEHLANAYAAVVTNMPRKSARPASG